MRYFVYLKYNGAPYNGWQRQVDAPTIQECLERALSTLLRTEIEVVGAGRTDTGVNASYYVAHFDAPSLTMSEEQTVYKLNAILGRDIAVTLIRQVTDDAHARFGAKMREYQYFIDPTKNPFTQYFSWQCHYKLDVEEMNRAAEKLLKYEDFTSFAKLNSNNKSNICHISYARWDILEDGRLRFTIRADRFLRNMVRAIVGTLVDVGRGRYTPEQFGDIVESRELSRSSGGAPPQGLFLSDVKYDDAIFDDERD